MNLFKKVVLKAISRDLYKRRLLAEQDEKFLQKALAHQTEYPPASKTAYAFKHSGNAGDIIYALPALFALSSEATAELYLKLDEPMSSSAERGRHPMGNVMLNTKMFSLLRPLLLSQPQLHRCETYAGQAIDYDLDVFRNSAFRLNSGHIARWYFLHFGVTADLGRPWLQVEPEMDFADRIVIARSGGYHAPGIDYSFMKRYPKLTFVGTPDEFDAMRMVLPRLEYQPVSDFLELARIIAGSRFFIGNQSFPFSLAEAMKVRRALEVYYVYPNVIVEGGDAYDFCFQPQFEMIVEKLVGST